MRSQAFGRYDQLQRISMGGMAEVFRAIHTPTGTPVALKRILPEIAEDEEFIKMFEDEARIASSLEHPHIARCLDYGSVGGDWYIAFEYVDGKDMRVVFDRGVRTGEQPPLSFILYVFERIGEGLAYAHARRDPDGLPVSIVHRDVSPQNIIVSFDGDVKLIDFGIAKAAGKLSRTQVGTIKGKFGYMSPEQVRGIEVDQRADIFSMGICLWELLTGKRLFFADNELLVIEKVRKLQVPPPSQHNSSLPPELDHIVLKALAKDPDERYRAARDVHKDLNRVASDIGELATRDQIAHYMRRTFPEAREGGDDMVSSRQVQENRAMAQNDKAGSDLDIFEGLSKKGGAPGRASSAPPSAPPPPTQRGVAPPPPPPPSRFPVHPPSTDPAKRTLLGIAATPPPAQHSPSSPPTPSSSRQPPPPPGRGSLPQVVPPPPRPSSTAGMAPPPVQTPPPPVATAPPPAPTNNVNAAASVDMDWDDEDEATHIFDKGDDGIAAGPMGASGVPKPPETRPIPAAGTPPPPVTLAKPKSTLLGLTAPMMSPPPPPPGTSAPGRSAPPPPPPSVGSAFARASSGPSGMPGPAAFPPPPTINPVPTRPPGPPGGMGMTMPLGAPPPPPPQNMSAPMAMPSGPPQPMRPLPPPAMPPPDYGQQQQYSQPPMQSYAQAQPPMRSMEATALVRPPPSRTGLWIALVLLVVAVAAVAGVFVLMPRTGRILVNVADTKGGTVNRVDIFVDGRKQCDTAPCIVEQVTSGAHDVKILADGYDPPPVAAVNVEARKDATVNVTLNSLAAKGTGLKVAGTQAGVKLFVDDKEIGPLPQEIRDMAAGDHTIRIAGSERYQALEKHVSVDNNQMQDLGTVTLKVLKGKATISLGTPGARVYLVSGTDRRELPMLPISVDIDTAKSWALEASKTGYDDYKQPISFDDGQAEKTYVVTLDLKGTSAPPPAPPPVVANNNNTVVTPPPPPPPANPPPATGGGGDAFLNINSIPPSTCFLDGKALGSTPKVHIQVSPGVHTVKFVNSDQGLTKTISVKVNAGETKPAVAKLD
jgi:serine/threonine protein kinase